jgi:hypothetical protein
MELGEPDASGRRRPVPIEGSETTMDVDVVIKAIGQRPLLDWYTLFCVAIARELLGARAGELLGDLTEPPPTRASTAALLRDLRVRRMELNPVAQGLPVGDVAGFAVTLHQPWSILAATRFCPQQRITDPDAPLLVRPCARECLERAPLRLDNDHFPQPLYLVGNAVLGRGAEPAELPRMVDRIVERSLAA